MDITMRENELVGFKTTIQPWIVCFAASLFFFYEFIQGNMFASIADNIMQEFGIQADKMAYLSSIYYISNVIFLFFAGMMLDRLSARRTMLFAMLLCVSSTFVLAHTQTYTVALICRFVTGFGSAFCFLGPMRVASRWFPSHRMALVTGCIVTIAMTGGMVAQYPLTRLVNYAGWRDALMMVGWLGTLLFIFMSVWLSDSPPEDINQPHAPCPKTPIFDTLKMAYFNTQALRTALYTSLMNMGIAVFGAMMGTLYLVQRLGIEKEEAAFINSLLFLGTIIGGPVMGFCSDKLGQRIMPMKVAACFSLLTVLAILFLPVSTSMMGVSFFFLGFFTSAQIISYALVAESNPPAITATAISLISMLTQGGYALYQNLYSTLLVHYGHHIMQHGTPVYTLASYQTASMMIPIGIVLALLCVFRLKETYCHRA